MILLYSNAKLDLSENNAVKPSEMDRTVIGVSHFVARFSIFLFFGCVCVQ